MSETILVHHGIKGQKWGVRRYRNEDGSLTAAGRKQYDKNLGERSTLKKGTTIYRTVGFGTKDGSQLRDKVVKELKKQGYDGMSDVAGIGGGVNLGRETRQATILFDTENNLKEKSTRRITTEKRSRAKDRYNMWQRKTNPYSSLRYSL